MKFHRESNQRRALIKGLAESLILNGSIETTLPKAKTVARYTERLITKAKKGKEDLHKRRQVIAGLMTTDTAHKLVDEIAPQLSKRDSGYLRVKRSSVRRGDTAQMAKVSFVDELKTKEKPAKPQRRKTTKKSSAKRTARQSADKPAAKPTAKSTPAIQTKSSPRTRTPSAAPKRSGRRGNR